MSLILDALNRSRQEAEKAPGLATVPHVAGDPGAANWTQWLLVAGLALAVLAIGWLLYDRLPRSQPVAEEPAPAATVRPLPSAAPRSAEATPPAKEQRAVATPPAEPAPATPVPQPVAESPPPVDPGVAALYAQREVEPPAPARVAEPAPRAAAEPSPAAPAQQEESLDIEALVARAQAELADARLTEHEVPFLSSLSQQTKDGIPTIMYQQHDYSGDPARSSVVINGKTLRTGESTSGLKVEEILPDSVVLEYRGSRFRLRALNSWVNL